MKTTHLFTALLLAGTPCMAQQTTPQNAAITATATDEAIIKEAGDIFISICLQMEAVHDKESADALAAAMLEAKPRIAQLFEECLAIENGAELAQTYVTQKGFTEERFEQAEKKLCDAKAYGSVALAEMIGIPISEIMDLQPAPQELLSEVETLITQTMAQLHPGIKGGPGTSEETAWIMPASDDAVSLQYQLIRALGPEITSESQALISGADLKTYDMHPLLIRTADGIYTAELWFDISDYWGKMTEELEQEYEHEEETRTAPTEEQQALLAEAALIMKDICDILSTVHDKESAEEAARAIIILHSRWDELMEAGLDHCNIDDFFKAFEEVGITEEMLDKIDNTLKKANFYGSEALRNAGGFF